ncbi:MAG: hypothetical protein ACFFBI_05855 [Promethearchaeota archaeon]
MTSVALSWVSGMVVQLSDSYLMTLISQRKILKNYSILPVDNKEKEF